ncbi:MAG TPA: hypothetical protein VHB25_03045 [Gemmatimonadaceae bacterium]|nr:hypothetical protein [Gemmatimonadaceae bacterium]
MTLLDPQFSTRRWLKVGLTVAGAIAGGVFGIVLTRVGKIVSGAPPATFANYVWNATVFGVMAGFVSPIVAWSALRRAPLWRTVAEPLTCAVAGAGASVILGMPLLMLVLPPAGLVAGFLNLRRRYPDPNEAAPALSSASAAAGPRAIAER